MSWSRRLWIRIRRSVNPAKTSEDLEDELRFHIEMETRDLIAQGVPPEEARRRALAEFGGVERFKEETREAPGFNWLDEGARDLRYAFRQLRRNPAFAAVAVLTLVLGIGANTAVFSVVNEVLLRPLPYGDADQIVYLWLDIEDGREGGWTDGAIVDLQEYSSLFEVLGRTQGPLGWHLVSNGEPSRVSVLYASGGYFGVLGAEPALGSWYGDDDGYDASVLSYGTWQQAYGGDPDIIGRTVRIHGQDHVVHAVASPGLESPLTDEPVAVFRNLPGKAEPDRVWFRNVLYGRMRPGVTLQQVTAELGAFTVAQAERFPRWVTRDIQAHARGLHDRTVAEVRPTLLTLLATALFVLLIAAANVSNLLLVRAEARSQETAIRLAIGAGARRLARQYVTEAGVLGLLGGLGGLIMALLVLPGLLALRPPELATLDGVSLDRTVISFALALTGLSLLIFGLAPLVRSLRTDLSAALGDRAGAGRGGRGSRLSRSLIVAEVALSVVLLVGAGLLTRSLLQLGAQDPGFDSSSALTFDVELPAADYTRAQHAAFFNGFEERLRGLPGVESVGSVWPMPFTGSFSVGYALTEEERKSDERPVAQYQMVTSGYVEAAGLELREGRFFESGDPREVVVVDERFARLAWPGESALGRRVSVAHWGGPGEWATVIGVVGHVRYSGFREEGREMIYLFWDNWNWSNQMLTTIVRTSVTPLALTEAARRELRAMDSTIPMTRIRTLGDYLREERAATSFATLLVGVFAGLAALLAAVGLYGVISYNVSRRRHEIGLRMALGASRGGVFRLIVAQGLRLTALGVGLGLLGAVGVSRLLDGLLFQVEPRDPLTMAGVGVLLLSVSVVATYMPALRATLVDPARALRSD